MSGLVTKVWVVVGGGVDSLIGVAMFRLRVSTVASSAIFFGALGDQRACTKVGTVTDSSSVVVGVDSRTGALKK